MASQNSRRALLALLLPIVAIGLWFVFSGNPKGDGGKGEAVKTEQEGGAGVASGDTDQVAKLGKGTAEAGVSKGDAATRERVEARYQLKGRILAEGGISLAGGTARLHQAASEDNRSLAGLMNGITASEERDFVRSFLARGEPVAETVLASDGSFAFNEPAAAFYWLTIEHPYQRLEKPLHVEVVFGESKDLGEIQARAAASLRVVVVDARDRPVEGASLKVYVASNFADMMDPSKFGDFASLISRMEPKRAKTDARGAAAFNGLAETTGLLVIASKHGFADALSETRVETGRQKTLQLRVLRGASLALRFKNAEGEPVGDCRLSIRYQRPYRTQNDYQSAKVGTKRLHISKEGRVESSDLAAGPVTMHVEAPGYLAFDLDATLQYGVRFEREFTLDRGLTVEGRVVDAAGKAIPEPKLLKLDAMMSGGFMGFEMADYIGKDLIGKRLIRINVRGDEEGRFRLGGFRKGDELKLLVGAEGFATTVTDKVVPGEKKLEIVLQRTAQVTGVVKREEDGAPVRDFKVLAIIKAFMIMERPVAQAKIRGSDDGRFVLEGFAPQSVKIEVRAPGRASWFKSVSVGEDPIDLGTIKLGPPASISGVVVDGRGVPIADATVRIAKGGIADMGFMSELTGVKKCKSDAKGRFLLEKIKTGRLKLIAERDGFAVLKSKTVRVKPGQSVEGVRLELGRGGKIGGTLVDEQGAGLAGWRIYVSSPRAITMKFGESGADGSFEFEGLRAGLYEVQAFPSDLQVAMVKRMQERQKQMDMKGMMKSISEMVKRVVREKVTVRDGEEESVRLVYQQQESGSELTRVEGRVTVGGQDVKDGWVELVPPGQAERPLIATLSGGRYKFLGVLPGTYNLRVRGGVFSGYVGEPRRVVVPGKKQFVLNVALPGGEIRGSVLTRKGRRPVGNCVVTLVNHDSASPVDPLEQAEVGQGLSLTDASGRFVFKGLAAGTYDIVAREHSVLGGSGGSGAKTGLVLSAEQKMDGVEIELGAGAELLVRVRGGSGPLSGALVTLLDARGKPRSFEQRGVSSKEGEVRFSSLAPGAYRVTADAKKHAPGMTGLLQIREGKNPAQEIVLRPGVDCYLLLKGELPKGMRADEILAYSVWTMNGVLVRAGRYPYGLAESLRKADPKGRLPVGSFAPGRYRLRLESKSLGKIETEGQVPSAKEATLPVPLKPGR